MLFQFIAKYKIPLIIIGLVFLAYLLLNYNRKPPPVPQIINTTKNLFDKEKIKKQRAERIYSILNSALANQQGKYTVLIRDLKTGEQFAITENESMTAASIYKLAVMYKTYDALEKGEIQKDDTISASKSDLDNLLLTVETENPNQSGQGSDTTISYTVTEALRLMVTISDNYSALLLADKFGWENIDQFLKDKGVVGFDLVSGDLPKTTAGATAQILEKIYRGQAVSRRASNEMEKLLLNQTVNDRIPKYLPQNTKVAHKTGELDSVRNDAGIVFGQKSDYIFVFFSDTNDPDDGSEIIATVAKKVFGALENR